MRPVYQRQRGDCVVAAVASLAEVSYRAVKSKAGCTRNGLDRTETRWLMNVFGLRHVYSMPRTRKTAREWAAKYPNARALLIVHPPVGADHAVVVDHAQVHDPLRDPVEPQSVVVEVYRCRPPSAARKPSSAGS